MIETREEWLAARKSGVGASEAAAVLGVDPYKSAYSLWAEKSGLVEPGDVGEAAYWGNKLEPVILDEAANRMGWSLTRRPFDLRRHDNRGVGGSPSIPLFATLDAVAYRRGDLGVVDAKAPGLRQAPAWAAGAPLVYQVQIQAQLAVTGFSWGALAVLLGGQEFTVVSLERDDAFIAVLEREVAAFWARVEDDEPPPIDASVSTIATLDRLHEEDSGITVALGDEALQVVHDRAAYSKTKGAADKEYKQASRELKAMLGTATWGTLPDGRRVQYRIETRAGYTVEPKAPRILRVLKK